MVDGRREPCPPDFAVDLALQFNGRYNECFTVVGESLMSVAERAKTVYSVKYRKRLEAEHHGEFVAIEPESQDSFVAATFVDAALAAKERYPSRKSFVIRIGYEAAVHIGAATK